ncbi:MAG: hypothetical protein WC905_02045 [Patescibacteria group bacterium]|jgi:hypothetical protein
MVSRAPKNKNSLNLILNDYFNLVLAVILIIFLFGAYFLVLNPKIRTTKQLVQDNIESQIRLYNNSQRKLANLKMVDSLYQKINKADLQKFDSVLPNSYVRERLFGELEEIIGQGGWMIKSIRISSSADDVLATPTVSPETASESPAAEGAGTEAGNINQQLGRISVHLSLQAIDYTGFKKLLKILETNLRLFDVSQVDISPAEEQAEITLVTYYYRALK